MMMGKKPMGIGLQNIVAGDRWDQGFPTPIGLPRRPMDEGGAFDTPEGLGGLPTKPKGLFAEGSKGQIIAGILGDALAGINGGPALFTQSQMQNRAADREQAQWGLRRQGELADYEQKQQIEAKYRKPTPHYFESNDGSVGMIGPDGKPQILYKDPTPKMNFIPDGLGGGQWVAVPGQAPAMPNAPPTQPLKPVGKLRPVGGPTAPQSGTFR